MNPQFDFNKKYEKIFTTDKMIIDLVGGRGRGGSHTATDYILFLMITESYFRGAIMRRVKNDIKDSLFRDMCDRIEDKGLGSLFKVNNNDYQITYIPKNHILVAKGFTGEGSRSAMLKSLAGFTTICIEEADEVNEDDFDQLKYSLRTTKAKLRVIRIFNPPNSNHWIWRDYVLTEKNISIFGKEEKFFTYKPKSTSDVEMIFGTYKDNIQNIDPKVAADYESNLTKKPKYYYSKFAGLIGSDVQGQVYEGWKSISDKEFEEIECRPVYALDFGYFPDPTALVQVKWKGKTIYCKELIYENKLHPLDIAKKMIDMGVSYKDLIIADYGNAGQTIINEFSYAGFGLWKTIEGYGEKLSGGFNVQYAIKGTGSIRDGIQILQDYDVFVTENSANIWRENREYIWAVDRFGQSTGMPIDASNHSMDAIRYFVLYRSKRQI